METEYSIRTEGVCRYFKVGGVETRAVDDVSLQIPARQLVVLRGRSGSGKTTLMNMMGAMDMPTAGKIWMGDEEITAMTDAQRDMFRRKNTGFVFQSVALITMMSAYENVEFALRMANYPKKQRHDRAMEALRMVGLEPRANHMARELSGGEQQRVAVARAIAPKPRFLFADEPTSEQDSATGLQVLKVFQELAKETTVVITTHDEVIASMADCVFAMEDGKLI